MTPPLSQYLSSYLLISILPCIYCTCVHRSLWTHACARQPRRYVYPLCYFFSVYLWFPLKTVCVVTKMKWNGSKMEHAVPLICFLNYLPCAELLFAAMLRACLARLCFGFRWCDFIFSLHVAQLATCACACIGAISRRFCDDLCMFDAIFACIGAYQWWATFTSIVRWRPPVAVVSIMGAKEEVKWWSIKSKKVCLWRKLDGWRSLFVSCIKPKVNVDLF